ncbi:MAG: hypothetical protein R6X14_10380, partial [bacterium]
MQTVRLFVALVAAFLVTLPATATDGLSPATTFPDEVPIAPAGPTGHEQLVADGLDAVTIPRLLSYQGKLTDTLGTPVPNGSYSVVFRLYSVPSGGSSFWNETQNVLTRNGLFTVLLGAVTAVPTVPNAGALYLGMAVGSGGELTPRLRITSAAYAYKADTANYALAGGSADNAWVRGSPDSVLRTIRNLGIARGGAGSALLGTQPFTHVNLGAQCSTGFHSAAVVHATVGGGYGNFAGGNYSTVGGGDRNRVIAYATVGGGSRNVATNQYAAIGGGSSNEATGLYAAIGGGSSNDAGGQYAAVGGGAGNRANGLHATVAGGSVNSATDSSATVAGGVGNEATAKGAAVGGGSSNAASAGYAAVGGGYDNTASGEASSVGGGLRNSALGERATIAGGVDNRAMNSSSFVGGGSYNRADGAYSVIAGGASNNVTGERSTIAGGSQNVVNGTYAAVGGGSQNTAYGYYSMIPGGEQNRAAGRHSFAAGRYARANHRGAFVWSDSAASAAESVYSTNYNQFRVRARGGTWFFSNSSQTTGVTLASNSNAWASTCDSLNLAEVLFVEAVA